MHVCFLFLFPPFRALLYLQSPPADPNCVTLRPFSRHSVPSLSLLNPCLPSISPHHSIFPHYWHSPHVNNYLFLISVAIFSFCSLLFPIFFLASILFPVYNVLTATLFSSFPVVFPFFSRLHFFLVYNDLFPR